MMAMEAFVRELMKEMKEKDARIKGLEEELAKRDELHTEEMKKKDEEMKKQDELHTEEMKEKDEEMKKQDELHAEEMKKQDELHAEEMKKQDELHAEEMNKKAKEQYALDLTNVNQDIEENFKGISSTEMALSDEDDEKKHTTQCANVIKFQKTTRSLSETDDRKWKIKKEVILEYLEDTKCEDWKLHRKKFREKIYMNEDYLKWSSRQEKNGGCQLRKYGGNYVITAGCNWVNWKNTEGEWHCVSFHFVKQIYDTMAKRK